MEDVYRRVPSVTFHMRHKDNMFKRIDLSSIAAESRIGINEDFFDLDQEDKLNFLS